MKAPEVSGEPQILRLLDADLQRLGVIESRLPIARLLYLAIASRVFERPCSVVVRGPSSAGKSWLCERVLELVDPSAYYSLTSMSERSLVYDSEPIAHRALVVGEAVAIAGPQTGALLRELLSSGKIRHSTVSKGKDGRHESAVLEREGPCALVSTTTAFLLHAETETRLFSVDLADSAEAHRAIRRAWGARAAGDKSAEINHERWRELSRWLESGERRVVLPFGPALGEALPAGPTRLNRDLIGTITLVQAHALLHRQSRKRDREGRIIATLADYEPVREILDPIVSAAVGRSVSGTVRRAVEAVEALSSAAGSVSVTMLAGYLGVDKATASRQARGAITGGYLFNDEHRKGQPARLRVGDPLPEPGGSVLPKASDLDA